MTEASGRATHMGRVGYEGAHCPEDDVIDDGQFTIIAANGDKLYGVYDYPAIDEGEPVTFTGGTGRFAGASGGGVWEYEVELTFRDNCDPDNDPLMCLTNSPWWSTLTGTTDHPAVDDRLGNKRAAPVDLRRGRPSRGSSLLAVESRLPVAYDRSPASALVRGSALTNAIIAKYRTGIEKYRIRLTVVDQPATTIAMT